MPYAASGLLQPTMLSAPIRHRTLVLIRWGAIAGQSAAVVAALALGLQFDWPAVVTVIAAAMLFNLWLSTPGQKRRQQGVRPTGQLCFDLIQVVALLALTGGLSNPFALLALAPVTIAATAMTERETVILGTMTVGLITIMGWWAMPIATANGNVLTLPPLLLMGHWLALIIGVAFFAISARRVATELAATSSALAATQMALAREQKLQHLGGVVAAAAHEMGTPLATMKLVASELGEEIAAALPERDELQGDITLLRDSVDRCRDILRQMGRAGKDDLVVHSAPLLTIIEEAASPHDDRGQIVLSSASGEGAEPVVARDPAIVHGLRNLIQNAVDFSDQKVTIAVFWDDVSISVTIQDDGPGYPPGLIARIGEPFLTTRSDDGRGHYEGMGLGLFIAKTLLERSGARLRFENARPGAKVNISWPRNLFEHNKIGGLGKNPAITG